MRYDRPYPPRSRLRRDCPLLSLSSSFRSPSSLPILRLVSRVLLSVSPFSSFLLVPLFRSGRLFGCTALPPLDLPEREREREREMCRETFLSFSVLFVVSRSSSVLSRAWPRTFFFFFVVLLSYKFHGALLIQHITKIEFVFP